MHDHMPDPDCLLKQEMWTDRQGLSDDSREQSGKGI